MKCLTVGGAMIDTIAIVESDRIERMSMRNSDTTFLLLEEGRKTEALEVSTHCGGGAVNTAVALSRMGYDVATMVKLGRDQRADTILTHLADEGVSTRWAMRDARAPTGASVMISSHERDAAIFTFRGVNTLLEPQDLRDDAFAVDLVYISALSNASAERFPEIVDKARAADAMIAANPGIRQLSARGGAFLECLARLDILSINRTEADALVPALVGRCGEGGCVLPLEPGEKPPQMLARGLAGGGYEMSLPAFVKFLSEIGLKYVLVTDGSEGAFAGTGERIVYCPAITAEVKGTAGAGDAFASTFSGMIRLGASLEDALVAASANAASTLGHVNTQSGLLDGETLRQRVAELSGDIGLRSWPL